MEHVYEREEGRMVERFDSATELEWQDFARFVAQPHVADRLIARAKLTPYRNIDGYMERDWLFNPFPGDSESRELKEFPELASVRIHHILRPDHDRHHHNHPWNARTVILRGWYTEKREGDPQLYLRGEGTSAAIGADTFHRITEVSPGGVWTMFFMGDKAHSWGFNTEGGYVPWRTYLGVDSPMKIVG